MDYGWLPAQVLAGGLGGVASRTATAPLERLRVMAQMGAAGGTWSLFRGVVAREGWRGLFVGNLAHCVRVFPCGAITCTAYGRLLAMTDARDWAVTKLHGAF